MNTEQSLSINWKATSILTLQEKVIELGQITIDMIKIKKDCHHLTLSPKTAK